MVENKTDSQLRQLIISKRWDSPYTAVWDYVVASTPEVVFLAPPLDTVPSTQGNAIYVLVERLAEMLPFRTLVLANGARHKPIRYSPIQDRILYYQGDTRPTLRDLLLPYMFRKKIWGVGFLGAMRYARAAVQVCQALRPKVLVVEDTPIYCPLIHRNLPGTRIVLHQHINAPDHLPFRHWQDVMNSTARIVFVANQTAKSAELVHGTIKTPYQVIYNGVNLEHYEPKKWRPQAVLLRQQRNIPAGAQILLFVGRLIPGKGVLEAVKSFAAAALQNVHFLIVGDISTVLHNRNNEYLSTLHQLATKTPNVHLVGRVDQRELPKYYAASDVVIVPSIVAEGLPKVITEALAMGKPVIASDRGGIWEILHEGYNGWLLSNPIDTSQLAQMLTSVFSDVPRLRQMSETILDHDRAFMSENRMVQSFLTLLSELL